MPDLDLDAIEARAAEQYAAAADGRAKAEKRVGELEAELRENEGVMNVLRRQRDESERKLEDVWVGHTKYACACNCEAAEPGES